MALDAAASKKNVDPEVPNNHYDALNHIDQPVQRSCMFTKKYVIYSILASMNSLVLGYGAAVISGALIFMEEDLKITEVQQEVLIGIFGFVSIIGSLGGGKMSDLIGRKWTLAIAALLLVTSSTVMTLAPSFEVLLIGRLFGGVGMGVGLIVASVYIAEISPSHARGFLTSLPELSVNVGIFLSYISNYALSGLSVHISWRIMLGVGVFPGLLVVLALFIIPESPRWLVMRNRLEEARLVLIKTNGNETNVEEKLQEIILAAGLTSHDSDNKSVLGELLCPSSSSVRRMLVVGLGIQFFQQITGVDVAVYYSPKIFKDAGIESNSTILAATIVVGLMKALFVFVASLFIDRVGRKPLLYLSTVGMTFCLAILGFSLAFLGKGQVVAVVAVICVCANVSFFSVGMGPICWVVTSEIFPLRLRAQATSLAVVVNRGFSGLIAMTFLSLVRSFTVGGTFFIYAALSALSVVFVYYLIPETKGKSLEQLQFSFQERGRKTENGESQHLLQKA